jgi:hypothetical protein
MSQLTRINSIFTLFSPAAAFSVTTCILNVLFLFLIFPVDNQTLEKLIDASFAVKRNAYCPYSNFPVGAALLCPDGTIITGKCIRVTLLSVAGFESNCFLKTATTASVSPVYCHRRL